MVQTKSAPDAQEASVGTGWCCGLHNHLSCIRSWPYCLGSRTYILPTGERSIVLGSCPSCQCIIMASFLILLYLPAAVILLGMTPRVPAEKLRRHWPFCSSPSYCLVKKLGLLFIPLARVPNSGSWQLSWNGHGVS